MQFCVENSENRGFKVSLLQKWALNHINPQNGETFNETFMKPYETFTAFCETFVTSEVSQKFHAIILLNAVFTWIYRNTCQINETCQVSRKNGLHILYWSILGVFGSNETFEAVDGRFPENRKSAFKLFRQNSRKVNSLSESFKRRLL